jgi:uncharacterized hydrophobic protein (TIGR00271 family)
MSENRPVSRHLRHVMNQPELIPEARQSLRAAIAHRFSLLDDKADDAEIDRSLRAGAELGGATPWILMFAIVIASVGLNTNSTAVIIGAMLVSPLMGPIVGMGYGIGIYDVVLIRRSLSNLAIAAGISLATSTVYFLITPLSDAQSELLARTTPSLWDVLIALAGGMAGIIGQTRREKSNVIPGVAIATALMPPLCTAGYGLANGNWQVFGGAFYLFSINCVFIAFSAVVIIDLLRLPRRAFVDKTRERRVKRALLAIVLLTGLPSIWLAARLVDNEVFGSKARAFVRAEFRTAGVHVIETHVTASTREIELTLVGPRLPQPAIAAIERRMPAAGLEGAHLLVHQAANESVDKPIDVGLLKADILADIVKSNQQQLQQREDTIASLRQQLAGQAAGRRDWIAGAGDMAREFAVQFPQCAEVLVGQVALPDAATAPLLSARCRRMPGSQEVKRAEAWFRVRAKSDQARLLLARAGH